MDHSLKNQVLMSARFQSFILEGELVCKYNLVFFQTENGNWFKISVGDGESEISEMEKPPRELVGPEMGGFEYPHFPLDGELWERGIEIVGVREYIYKGEWDESFGLLIDFNGLRPISIHEGEDENIEIAREIPHRLNESCTLVDYYG